MWNIVGLEIMARGLVEKSIPEMLVRGKEIIELSKDS